MNSKNRGIIITGGNVNLGTVAVGDNARAKSTVNNSTASLDELRQEIERLLASYRQTKGSLGPEEEETAKALSSEARKAKPDRTTLHSLLERLSEGAGTVHALVEAFGTVKELVSAVLV